jgi:hypothetical protein
MKAYERRARQAYPFFTLAAWDERNLAWKAGKTVYEDEATARCAARKSGRYRITRFDERSNAALEPFTVPAP